MQNKNFENAAEKLERNGMFSSYTKGNSMYPLFRTCKDIVNIVKPEFPLKKYDVALYKVPNLEELVLHRVIKVKPNGVYIIRGDNTYKKETVKEADIIGVLSGFYRNGKYRKPDGFGYKFYIFLNVISYPFRYFKKIILWPFLSKCKRALKKALRFDK